MSISKGMLKSKRLGSAIFCVLIIFSCAHHLTAAEQNASRTGGSRSARKETSLTTQARTSARRAIAAVGCVLVRNESDDTNGPRQKGSAVIVRSDGVVSTNHHVIFDKTNNKLYDEIYLNVSGDGRSAPRRYRLKALLISKEYDLALLRIDSDGEGKAIDSSIVFPAIELGDSRAVELLDDLIIIGFPAEGGSTVTVNQGVIEGKDILGNWIKTDARVIHGNSGGAAIDSEGRLIGIPTKVLADRQPIDKNGDGFPDDYRFFGAVGFLRPAHLVGEMLAEISKRNLTLSKSDEPKQMAPSRAAITVRGIVMRSNDRMPIAGAMVGLLQAESKTVTGESLLTWGGTNADGQFTLNKPVPPGRYTLRAKAFGHDLYVRDVEIDIKNEQLVIEMRQAVPQ